MGRLVRRAADLPVWLLTLLPGLVVLLVVILTPDATRQTMSLDVEIYRGYADRLLAGEILYRQVPVEYPPLAVLPMLLPRLIPGGDETMGYLWRFAAISAVLTSLTGWLLWQLGGRARSVLVWWAVVAMLSWTAITLRYDIWPVTFAVGGVLLARRDRPAAAGALLGVGSLLKVFPALLVPVLVLAALARGNRVDAVRLAAGWAVIALLVMGTAFLIGGLDSMLWLRYQSSRGLQVESLGASLLLALHLLAGLPVDVAFRFGAVELVAAGSDLLAGVAPYALVGLGSVLIALVIRAFLADHAAGRPVRLAHQLLAGAALVVGMLLTSKVFSFQYALWLAPFVPFLPRRERWLGVVVVGMSTAVYTVDYVGLWHLATLPIVLLVVRNLLLLLLLGWLVLRLASWGAPGLRRGPRRGQASASIV